MPPVALLLLAAAALQPAPAGIPVWDRLPDDWNGALWKVPPAPGQKGLWFGQLQVCGAKVAGAKSGRGRGGEPVLLLVFAPFAREEVARETARYLERPMPVRIDGRAIAAPTVEGPIEHGEIELHLATGRDRRRIAALARRRCPP